MVFSTALLRVTKSGEIIQDPSTIDAKTAASLHVLAFSPKGHLLLNESQGRFDFETWEVVRQRAESICLGKLTTESDGDVSMDENAGGTHLNGILREAVEDRLYSDYVWKTDSI